MSATYAILLIDITSVFLQKKNRIIYGKRGETVTLISKHGNVWCVEGKNGPFPVNIDYLKILNDGKTEKSAK